jgi:hypothetical protein
VHFDERKDALAAARPYLRLISHNKQHGGNAGSVGSANGAPVKRVALNTMNGIIAEESSSSSDDDDDDADAGLLDEATAAKVRMQKKQQQQQKKKKKKKKKQEQDKMQRATVSDGEPSDTVNWAGLTALTIGLYGFVLAVSML